MSLAEQAGSTATLDPPTVNAAGVATSPDGTAPAVPKPPRKQAPRLKYRADGTAKLTAVPEDWSAGKHLPLAKADFEDEAIFYDFKAAYLQKSADNYRQKAQDCRNFGNPEERKAAVKMGKLQKEMAEIQKKLSESLGPEAVQKLMQTIAQGSAPAPK